MAFSINKIAFFWTGKGDFLLHIALSSKIVLCVLLPIGLKSNLTKKIFNMHIEGERVNRYL